MSQWRMATPFNVMFTGSENIRYMNAEAKQRLDRIMSAGAGIITGNYRGADQMVLEYLAKNSYPNVRVAETGTRLGFGYPIEDLGRYPKQDIYMRNNSDYLLAFHDGISKGTQRNIDYYPRKDKICVVMFDDF